MRCGICGNEVAGAYCSKCGARVYRPTPPVFQPPAPKPKRKGIWRDILIVVVVLSFVVIYMNWEKADAAPSATTAYTTTATTERSIDMRVSAAEIISAYDSNEVQANLLYRGKYVELSGIVDRIDESLNQAIVHVNEGDKYTLKSVRCVIQAKQKTDAANLVKGQTVKIKGYVEGYLLLSVDLRDCSIIR